MSCLICCIKKYGSPPILLRKSMPSFRPRYFGLRMIRGSGWLTPGEFLRSPGCTEPGQFTYLQAFDKEFLNVVRFVEMNIPADTQGLISMTELEKYHRLTYYSGGP